MSLKKVGGINTLFDKLKTSTTEGITTSSIEQRINAFGSNAPPMAEVETCFQHFLAALNDLTLIILMIAAVVSIIINMITEEEHRNIAWIEGFAILCAVFISAGVQAINDYQKDKQFRELNQTALDSKKVTVIRDANEVEVRLAEVVVGDIVTIVAGDEIAGDAILINGSSVLADEASMTGESIVLHKEPQAVCENKLDRIQSQGKSNAVDHHDIPSSVLLSGTNIKNGSGKMLIIAVGDMSAIGKIRKTITDKGDDETPLQKKLDKIARQIGLFGLIAAILTLIIMIVRAAIDGEEVLETIVEGFLVAITVLVVAIPEGLPLAVTLSLAFSVKKMLKEKNLVRKLHACETMGGANIICSDKTGTLTKNEMYLTHFWNLEPRQIYNNETQEIVNLTSFVGENQLTLFHQATCCNSTADPDSKSGNPTEMAIVRYLKSCGVSVNSVRQRYDVVADEPFSSDRKRMSTLIRDDDGRELMLIKGASELILESCTNLLDLQTGNIKAIGDAEREEIKAAITHFAESSLRTIGVAYSFPEKYDKEDKDKNGVLACESSNLTLLGVCGIKDVIRPEVPTAVDQCRTAGVQVKMVTGDNKITARAIAKECRIIKEFETGEFKDFQVMLGKDFFEYVGGYSVTEDKKGNKTYSVVNGERFDRIYQHVQVLARSRPEDKLTMVVGLRERGNIVAVTGDGTNDAPALSKANVGFAMGVTGTEIAKQAADILLTDDNFNSIVSAVKWGRNIYDSIRKFLQFQLTVNVVAVIVTFLSAAVTKEAVLSAVQMLWVNLIMDTLASLALATEPPTDELLQRPPFPPGASIISKKMTKHIIGQAIYQMAVIIVTLFLGTKFLPSGYDVTASTTDVHELANDNDGLIRSGLKIDGYKSLEYGPSVHFTYNFNIFVMMTVFNFINARKLEDQWNVLAGVFRSGFFAPIVIIIFLLQIIIVTFGGIAFRCAPWGLRIVPWLVCLGFGIVTLLWRLIIVPFPEKKMCPAFGASEITEEEKKKMSSLSIKRSLSHRNSINKARGDYRN